MHILAFCQPPVSAATGMGNFAHMVMAARHNTFQLYSNTSTAIKNPSTAQQLCLHRKLAHPFLAPTHDGVARCSITVPDQFGMSVVDIL